MDYKHGSLEALYKSVKDNTDQGNLKLKGAQFLESFDAFKAKSEEQGMNKFYDNLMTTDENKVLKLPDTYEGFEDALKRDNFATAAVKMAKAGAYDVAGYAASNLNTAGRYEGITSDKFGGGFKSPEEIGKFIEGRKETTAEDKAVNHFHTKAEETARKVLTERYGPNYDKNKGFGQYVLEGARSVPVSNALLVSSFVPGGALAASANLAAGVTDKTRRDLENDPEAAGMSDQQKGAYAATVGFSEAASELVGNIPLVGAVKKFFGGSVADEIVKRATKNVVARMGEKVILAPTTEAIEEAANAVAQEIAGIATEYDSSFEWQNVWEGAKGGFAGGLYSSPMVVGSQAYAETRAAKLAQKWEQEFDSRYSKFEHDGVMTIAVDQQGTQFFVKSIEGNNAIVSNGLMDQEIPVSELEIKDVASETLQESYLMAKAKQESDFIQFESRFSELIPSNEEGNVTTAIYNEEEVFVTEETGDAAVIRHADGREEVVGAKTLDSIKTENLEDIARREYEKSLAEINVIDPNPTSDGKIMIEVDGVAKYVTEEEYREMQDSLVEEKAAQEAALQPAPAPVLKDGTPDFDNYTPAQLFEYTKEQDGEAVAIQDLRDEIDDVESDITKLRDQASKKKGAERVKIREKIRAQEAKLNELNSLIPAPTTTIEDTQNVSLENVPDMYEDRAEDARVRGYRNDAGNVVQRQGRLESNEGIETDVVFSDKDRVKGRFAIVEADQIQPSHLRGRVNPSFFLNEAQPKDRTGQDSVNAAERMAANLRPLEVIEGQNAYVGAPVVNARGEVIQGNGRTAGIQQAYDSNRAEAYREALKEQSERLGLDPAMIDNMSKPTLVRVLDVDDNTAIQLGQRTQSSTESGGTQSIPSRETSTALGSKLGNYVNILFTQQNEGDTLSETISKNALSALTYLYNAKVINETQFSSAIENGKVSLEGRKALQDVANNYITEGGIDNLPAMLNSLPSRAKKAIYNAIIKDIASETSLKNDIQMAIQYAYEVSQQEDFASERDVVQALLLSDSFAKQGNMFAPTAGDRFNQFERYLGTFFAKGTTKEISNIFDALYRDLNSEVNLFESREAQDKQTAINNIINGQEITNTSSNVDTRAVESIADKPEELTQAESEVNTNPTEAQKEAGNYKKGHIKVQGLDISIEQPEGSIRSGVDQNGKEWSVEIKTPYGYIRGTKGKDNDHIDVFLGNSINSDRVYVIDQVDENGKFDEHKVMIGFDNVEDARAAYLSNYEEGWQGLGTITSVSMPEFKKWKNSSKRKTKAFSEYKGIVSENNIVYAPRNKYKATDGKEVQYTLFTEDEMQGVSDSKRSTKTTTSSKGGVQRKGITSRSNLNKLKEGEFSYIERVFNEVGTFDFTGPQKIESYDDVAYIFKQLENAVVENSFVVLVKNGVPTVIHTGMGTMNSTMVSNTTVYAAVQKINPDSIYFVHNHPSGALKSSQQDQTMLRYLREAYGDKLKDGIIINLKSGKFGVFSDYTDFDNQPHRDVESEIPLKTYSFNEQIFSKDFSIDDLFQVKSGADIARFVASQRLGERDKISFLILNNQNQIVGNMHLPYNHTKKTKEIAKYMTDRAAIHGGRNVVMYGRFDMKSSELKKIQNLISTSTLGEIGLLDVLDIRESGFDSAQIEGLIGEDNSGYTNTVNEQNPIQFLFAGEKGISNLQGNEGVIRLENLSVAKEMEQSGKDAKAIKLATGWEKGADGLWRYEVNEDFNMAIIDKASEDAKVNAVLAYISDEMNSLPKDKDGSWLIGSTEEWKDAVDRAISKSNAASFIFERMSEDQKEDVYVSAGSGMSTKQAQEIYDNATQGDFRLEDFLSEEIKLLYPQLSDYTLKIDVDSDINTNGSFDAKNKTIELNLTFGHHLQDILAHEVQHAIQDIEGFAKGSNVDMFKSKRTNQHLFDFVDFIENVSKTNNVSLSDAFQSQKESFVARKLTDGEKNYLSFVFRNDSIGDIRKQLSYGGNIISPQEQYKRTAGEVESRNVQSRMGMTAQERLNSLAVETEDVAREDQIFITNSIKSALESPTQLTDSQQLAYDAVREMLDKAGIEVEVVESAPSEGVQLQAKESPIVTEAKTNGTYLKAPNGADTNLTPQQWEQVRSAEFKEWFGDWENDPQNASKVVDENGEPLVVYHGSVASFTIFDKSKASIESNLGAGFYFTNDYDDVASNYEGGGADFDNKIERRAEQIEQEDDVSYEEAKEIALKELYQEDSLLEVYLKINNPVYIGDNETVLTVDDIIQDYLGEDVESFDDEDVYYEQQERAFEYVATQLDDVLYGLVQDSDVDSIKDLVIEKLQDGLTFESLRNPLSQMYLESDNGEFVSSEVNRVVFEALDYDGVIDSTVSSKFNMDISEDAIHYVTFGNTQIKSATENVGTFDANNPDIRYMTVFHGSPHSFDAFDHSFMGSGEGAQAFGWGTYVTEVEGIGRIYADKLRHKERVKSDYPSDDMDAESFIKWAAAMYDITEKNQSRAFDILLRGEKAKEELGIKSNLVKQYENAINYLNSIDPFDRDLLLRANWIEKPTNIYTVEIPDNDGTNYLQREDVVDENVVNKISQKAMQMGYDTDYMMDSYEGMMDSSNLTGDVLYSMMQSAITDLDGNSISPKQVSEILKEVGYIGISYPAEATTGGRADNARNYVIFDESNLQIKEKVQFLSTPQGVVYGYTTGGKIYLTQAGLNPNTPIHEYTHIWDKAVQQNNPELWNRGKELMKQTSLWDEVVNDPNYSNIKDNEDLVASEVHSRLTGSQGAEILEQLSQEALQEQGLLNKANKMSVIQKLKSWVDEFWTWVKDTMTPWTREEAEAVTLEEFVNMPIGDLARATDLNTANHKNKVANVDYGDPLQFQIGKKKVAEYDRLLSKKRPELGIKEREDFIDYLQTLDDSKRENMTFKWFADGVVRVPEDQPKIDQAIKVSEKAKIDPMQYKSPMELIDAHADIKIKAERINPDEVPELSNKVEYEDGLTVYEVDDDKAGQQAMREIINTHFGEDASPWCLLQGDGEGNLTNDSWDYWQNYSSIPKRVAFRNGKLLAFSANDEREVIWWDRQDASHKGIPITKKMPNDELGRTADYLYEETVKGGDNEDAFKDVDIETREEFNSNSPIFLEENYYKGDATSEDVIDDATGYYSLDNEGYLDEDGDLTEEGENLMEKYFDEMTEYFNQRLAFEKERLDISAGSYSSTPTNIHKGNKQNGKYEEWRQNGSKRLEYEYKNGKIEKAKKFDTDESVESLQVNIDENGFAEKGIFVRGKNPLDIIINKPEDYTTREFQVTFNEFGEVYSIENDTDRVYRNISDISKYNQDILNTINSVSDLLQEAGVDIQKIKDINGLSDPRQRALIDNRDTFEPTNRSHERESIVDAANRTAETLGVPVNVVDSISDLPSNLQQNMEAGKRYPGVYQNGEVYIITDQIIDEADAIATVFHEVVGHGGIRALKQGDDFDRFVDKVFNSMHPKVREAYMSKYDNKDLAVEEYIAEFAENYSTPTKWAMVKGYLREFLRKIGIDLQMSDNDLAYTLWRGHNRLKDGYLSKAEFIANDLRFRDPIVDLDKFMSAEESGVGKMARWFVDSHRDLKSLYDEIKKRGGNTSIAFDPYTSYLLSSSKSRTEMDEFQKGEWASLMKEVKGISKKKITLKATGDLIASKDLLIKTDGMSEADRVLFDLELYLRAKHAPERNKEIAKRKTEADLSKWKDKFPESTEDEIKAQKKNIEKKYSNEVYAGISTKDANKIVKEYESNLSNEEITSLWDSIRGATTYSLTKSKEGGFISQDQFDAVDKMYSYYVPLRGWDESETDGTNYSETERGGVGSPIKEAKGRESISFSPLSNMGAMANMAIMMKHKNLYKQDLLRLGIENRGLESLIKVKKINFVKVVDAEGNVSWEETDVMPTKEQITAGDYKQVLSQVDTRGKTRDNVSKHIVPVFQNGVKYEVYLPGNRGVRIINAINKTDENLVTRNKFFQTMGELTRFMSANMTAKNPAFIIPNHVRDLLFASTSLLIEDQKPIKFLNKAKEAHKGIYDFTWNIPSVESDSYKEFLQQGGATGYIASTRPETLMKDILKEIQRSTNTRSRLKKSWDYVADNAVMKFIGELLDYAAVSSENSIRYAIYLQAIESGASLREAAIKAKEATVNFNRKGALSGVIGSFYTFFNAAIQGQHRAFGLVKSNPKKTAIALATFAGVGFVLSLFAREMGGDDENEIPNYENLSPYIRRNNMIFAIGPNRFVKMPMPPFFRLFYGMGETTSQMLYGDKKVQNAGEVYLSSMLGEFSPIDFDLTEMDKGLGHTWSALAPSVLRPVIEGYVTNRNFMGGDIRKKPYDDRDEYKVPQYLQVNYATNEALIDFSKWLNEITGGHPDISTSVRINDGDIKGNSNIGIFDINPASIDHVVKGILGGRYKFFSDMYNTAVGVSNGTLETRNIPVFSRFYENTNKRTSTYELYYQYLEEAQLYKYVEDAYYKRREFKEYIDVARKNKSRTELFMNLHKEVVSLNKELKQLDGDPYEEMKKQRDNIMSKAVKLMISIDKENE